MGVFATGQVVLLPFPFSDLSRSKYRLAVILADAGRGDWVLCQITSNPYADDRAVELSHDAFTSGGLQRVRYVRPGKLFPERFHRTIEEKHVVVQEGLAARRPGGINHPAKEG
ncbi:MAG: MazF family transcriptional regulator [Magnetococcales bacterium]|nr:MazF family transcriptional regulator [Magnetococcales bacterium]